MSEKNMGRKFKVGDKVKLTKAGEESNFFNPKFREGDTAEVLKVNMFDDSIWSIIVTSGEDSGHKRDNNRSIMTDTWFEHVDTKKEHKKKRKHFRMGDLVVLKDEVNTSEVAMYNNIQKGDTAMISSEEYNGALKVHFFTKEGYESDRVKIEALRLATKKERKSFRKYKVAKITYNDLATEEIEQDTETLETKTPPEYDVKAGDIVEVTLDVNGHPIGTIGEVVLVREDSDDYYNSVKVRDNKGILWNELDVKLVYRKPETKSK